MEFIVEVDDVVVGTSDALLEVAFALPHGEESLVRGLVGFCGHFF